jgi:hypothetical protein
MHHGVGPDREPSPGSEVHLCLAIGQHDGYDGVSTWLETRQVLVYGDHGGEVLTVKNG